MKVAQTILEQLGGNRFSAMAGAKNLVGGNDMLQFSIGRGAHGGANKVRITLDASDTYTVETFKIRGLDVKPIGRVSMVYADQLRSVFTNLTGFETSL